MEISKSKLFRDKFLKLFFLIVILMFQVAWGGDHGKPEQLCIMTYNIKHGNSGPPNTWQVRRPIMKKLLKQYAPDVIGMQEVLWKQVKDLAVDLKGYAWIGLGRNGGSHSEFMAIFYRQDRLDPLEFNHFWLSDYPEIMGSTTWGNTNRRMVTWVRFKDLKTNQEFYLMNTHFDHQVERARVNSAHLILQRIQRFRSGIPVFLMGDFNAPADSSEPYRILVNQGPFVDSWKTARIWRGEGLNTYNGFRPEPRNNGRRIDWILYKGKIKVNSAEIVDFQVNGRYPSDHFPVVAWVSFSKPDPLIWFQAHRGAIDEAPENTLAAYRHAWKIPGAIPEADVRITKDEVLICIHDDTLARTTNAPEEIAHIKLKNLSYDQIRKLDAGIKFNSKFAGEKIPTLREVFGEMVKDPNRLLYLDVKEGVPLAHLKSLVDEFGVEERIIFVNAEQEKLIQLKKVFPKSRTMTWLGGTPKEIKQKFEDLSETNFEGITQLQFHLEVKENEPEITYKIEPTYLYYALERLKEAGVDLQLRPFEFDTHSLQKFLQLGVKWFVTDAPLSFYQVLQTAQVEKFQEPSFLENLAGFQVDR